MGSKTLISINSQKKNSGFQLLCFILTTWHHTYLILFHYANSPSFKKVKSPQVSVGLPIQLQVINIVGKPLASAITLDILGGYHELHDTHNPYMDYKVSFYVI